jgi:hypothetical protein
MKKPKVAAGGVAEICFYHDETKTEKEDLSARSLLSKTLRNSSHSWLSENPSMSERGLFWGRRNIKF